MRFLTYHVAVTVEPSIQVVPAFGSMIGGAHTSLLAKVMGLKTGAAMAPRAETRSAVEN